MTETMIGPFKVISHSLWFGLTGQGLLRRDSKILPCSTLSGLVMEVSYILYSLHFDRMHVLVTCNSTSFPENIEINFGAAPTGIQQCNQPPQCAVEETVCGYTGLSKTADEPTTFRVRIGPSGGPRGYESITGNLKLKLSIVVYSRIDISIFYACRIIRLGNSLLH